MVCSEQQRLISQVQEHLINLADLARAEVDAMRDESENTWLEIDRQIELAIGEKERALGALKQHRHEHGC
jgi:hypothetical protein